MASLKRRLDSPGHDANQDVVVVEEPAADAGRYISVFLGALLVIIGVALSLLIFVRIGQALEDPRTLKPQLDRWEFVIRGYVGDIPESAQESPDRTPEPILTPDEDDAVPVLQGDEPATTTRPQPPAEAQEPIQTESEQIARFVGQVTRHSSRPIAIGVMLMLVLVLARISLGLIWAGARLMQKQG